MLNNKLTKIVATIGPASESEEMIKRLILAGVNIFRFNLKHNTVEWHTETIKKVRKVADNMGLAIGILFDLQGPSLRINMPVDDISVAKGDRLVFGEEVFKTGEKGFSITHPNVINHLQPRQKVLADDGTFTFIVEKKGGQYFLRSESTGVLKNRKSLNLPGALFPLPILTERDHEGLKMAAQVGVDFVALSFVRSAKDVKEVRDVMKKYGVEAKITSKIETKTGIDNIEKIVEESDSIMVARGDLGVELPMQEVPCYQKMIIEKCLIKSKPAITATQMLQSMINNPYPTRAEVSDVANAVYDYTAAVMLSAESATGSYPEEAVETMRNTVKYNEKQYVRDTRRMFRYELESEDSMLADAAYSLYIRLYTKQLTLDEKITGYVVFTTSGRTARLVSRYHPRVPIFAFTSSIKVRESLTMSFGVHPFYQKELLGKGEVKRDDIIKAIGYLKDREQVKVGDKLVVLHGDFWGIGGGTSTIRTIEVE
jgi:pyruvate kinase